MEVIKTDPDQSSYLRILRYEPLVIEDVAEWLAARDVPLAEMTLKPFFDEQSICCVSRESLVKGSRSRY